MKSPNYRQGRAGFIPVKVVLHVTEGNSTSALSWFMSPRSQVSAHWLVDERGSTYNLVNEGDTAWHAGAVTKPWKDLIVEKDPVNGKNFVNPNRYTIGVEAAVSKANIFNPPNWGQWISWASLVNDICDRWQLDYENDLVDHNEIRHRVCPGPYFNKFFARILIKYFIKGRLGKILGYAKK